MSNQRPPADPPTPVAATATVRQRLVDRLSQSAASFEELRQALALSSRALEEHLRHVERSARGHGQRLQIEPSRCGACGYVFRDRSARHLHAPGRCPQCHARDITEPRFRLI